MAARLEKPCVGKKNAMKQVQPIPHRIYQKGDEHMPENKLDVRKLFEAIAYILGKREHVEVKVVSIRKKTEEETA